MSSMAGRRTSTRRGSRCSTVENHKENSNYVPVLVRSLDNDPWSAVWYSLVSRIECCRSSSAQFTLLALLGLLVAVLWAFSSLLDIQYICSQLCSIAVPFFALICGYLLLALGFRQTWTSTGIYITFCGSVVGETVGFFVYTALGPQSQGEWGLQEPLQKIDTTIKMTDKEALELLHPLYLLGYSASLIVSTQLAALSCSHSSCVVLLVILLRSIGCVCLPSLSTPLRPLLTYMAGLIGVLVAKYTESALSQPAVMSLVQNPSGGPTPSANGSLECESRVAAIRRRRTSSAALSQTSQTPQSAHAHVVGKLRRTSLPALLANKNHFHSSVSQTSFSQLQSSPCGMDVALLSEAHGLVTDLLLEAPTMPPHLVSGLKALATLLSPPLPSHQHAYANSSSSRLRHAIPQTAFSDIHYSSDTEEIPYTGEPLTHLSKRGKRFVPPNLLRRMSTSTWTTTTSATGMPTIEPEPSRKRTASFRNTHELMPPSLSPNQSHISLHGLLMNSDGGNCNNMASPVCKSRSHSTTSLYVNHPNGKRLMRERKTVCSLHPITTVDVSHMEVQQDCHSDSEPRYEDSEMDAALVAPSSAHDSRRGSGLSTRRSSGGGSGGSRRGSGGGLNVMADRKGLVEEQRLSSEHDVQDVESNGSPIAITSANIARLLENGRYSRLRHGNHNPNEEELLDSIRRRVGKPRTSDYESSDSPSSSDHYEDLPSSHGQDPTFHFSISHVAEDVESADEEEIDDINSQVDPRDNNQRIVILDDGSRYDLDALESDPLLDELKEWDYPIFDLLSQYGIYILSTTCYRVFLEVGLFETFKIPIKEFFNFFHALELGYRDKPYHNRTHASDVLHAVFNLTSQPIPGFQVLPFDNDPSPVTASGSESVNSILTQRASFNFEDSYGIMGANFPALELMALYTAATMHDYDHPGRTNAFLVSTLAPQAILYNDRSVLENHHAAAAWSLFLSNPSYNFLVHLDRAEFKRFRFLIIEAILATDLKRHFEILAEFNAKVNDADAPGIDWTNETDRLLAMQMCIKLADINGPCKTHSIHVQWTERIAEEFYEQGDEEAALGMPISPYMDRNNPQLAKLQESFINHLVAPLCNAYGEAGLLPGVWDDSVTEEDDCISNSGDKQQSNSSLADVDSESAPSEISGSDSDTPVHSKSSATSRKIVCLQARHLQENHEYWVALIKQEEELRQSDSNLSGRKETADSDTRESSPSSQTEDHMEPIEEENSPRSLDRSFSFEGEDSKL